MRILPYLLSCLLFSLATIASAASIPLVWEAPLTNEDGSALHDLAHYSIYYGVRSGEYDEVIPIDRQTRYTVLGLTAGTLYYLAVTASDTSGNESEFSNEVFAQAQDQVIPSYLQRIHAGGGAYTDAMGNSWKADTAYTTGGAGYVGGKTFSTKDTIANTVDDKLYQSERYGNFLYKFDVPNGSYEVTLHFAEIFHTARGKRLFDVSIEGVLVADNLDLYATVGHDVAMSLTFPSVAVSDGQLSIQFVSVKDQAKVSSIEVQAE